MFFNPRGDCEDIRIEDDVFRRKTDFVHQNVVGAFADFELALDCAGLPLLIKRHHHRRRAIAQNLPRLLDERLFAFLQADRIDDGFSLTGFQAFFNHTPFRGIDHYRHAGNFGFARNQIQEPAHGGFGVDQSFVHVDVDDLGAILDLAARNFQRSLIVFSLDQFAEASGAGDVGAFAHIHEIDFRCQRKRFQTG